MKSDHNVEGPLTERMVVLAQVFKLHPDGEVRMGRAHLEADHPGEGDLLP